MHYNRRFIVRRTISQERFEVLWKKRMEGEPTLKELAEMDEIINRDPMVREFVLKEMENWALQPDNDNSNIPPPATIIPPITFIGKLKAFFKRIAGFFLIQSDLAVN